MHDNNGRWLSQRERERESEEEIGNKRELTRKNLILGSLKFSLSLSLLYQIDEPIRKKVKRERKRAKTETLFILSLLLVWSYLYFLKMVIFWVIIFFFYIIVIVVVVSHFFFLLLCCQITIKEDQGIDIYWLLLSFAYLYMNNYHKFIYLSVSLIFWGVVIMEFLFLKNFFDHFYHLTWKIIKNRKNGHGKNIFNLIQLDTNLIYLTRKFFKFLFYFF